MSQLRRRAVSTATEEPAETPAAPPAAPVEKAATKRRSTKPANAGIPAGEVVKTEPVVAEEPTTRKLTSRRVDPDLMRAAFEQDKANRGTKTPFLKLTNGDNKVRILGPKFPDVDPLPFLFHKVHKYRTVGKFFEVVDFDWLFANPALAEKAMKLGKVTAADFAKWQKYGGDPWNIAGERARDLGYGGKDSKAPYLFSTAGWAYNVLNRADGKVYLWVAGKQKQQALEAIYAEADLFNEDDGHDINVKGNGQDNKDRRYTISVVVKPSAAGDFDPDSLTDLGEYAVRRAKGWDAKVLALFGVYGQFMSVLGLTPADFGVAAAAVSTAAASGKAPWEAGEEEDDDIPF
jgi:hypothetical protein